MFKYVHHVHYAVTNLDEMIKYFEKNFGMKPDDIVEYKERAIRDAIYNIGETQIQMSETTDANSGIGKFLAKNGPGVYHVAWAVDDIAKVAKQLADNGNKMRHGDGINESPRGYRVCNMELSSSHGVWLELAEAARKV